VLVVSRQLDGALTGVSGAGVGTWTKATSSLTHTKVEIWYGAVDIARTRPPRSDGDGLRGRRNVYKRH